MRFILSLALFLLGSVAFSQPPAGQAKTGDNYGKKIDTDNAMPASSLLALMNSTDTTHVRVKAHVNEVCAKKGCWFTFAVNDSTEAFVKMEDYGFFVPTALAGKNAVIDGVAFIKTTSVDELKHYAQDAKKPKKEIDAITRPKKEIRVIASGIVVAN